MAIRTRRRVSCFPVPDLAGLREQIQAWRSTCLGPQGRMPNHLWRQTLAVARIEGAERVAQALAVSLPALVRRLQASEEEPAAPAVFVDLTPQLPGPASPSELEILGADGTRLTLRFHGPPAALGDVIRSVLRR